MSNKVTSSSSKKKNKYSTPGNDLLEALQYIAATFGVILCTVLVLYLPNGYFGDNSLKKISAYKWVAGFGITILLGFTIALLVNYFESIDKRRFSTDYFSVGFVVMCFVSAIAGGYFTECVLGYEGWYMGILSQISFVLLYFFFSRFSKFYKVTLGGLMVVASIAFLVGILNRLMIDPFDFYCIGSEYELTMAQKNDFLSTMGQVSWYSGFVATVFPVGVGVFWASKDKKIRIWSGTFTMLAFLTLFSQNSDSAYMALLGFLMVFFWFSVCSLERMRRFMDVLLMLVGSTRILNILFLIHPNDELSLDTLSNFAINNNLMWIIFVAVALIWGAFYYCEKNNKTFHAKVWSISRYVVLGLVLSGIAISVIILIMSATGSTPEWLANMTAGIGYLNWNDDWGNHRGMSWTVNLWMLRDMGPLHNILGIGPDNYANFAYFLYEDQLVEMFDAVLANAHNEWMNALINYGIIGFACYLGIYVSAIKNFAKKQADNPILVGIIASIVSYFAHNFFCYETICCTPFLFIIIGIGTYIYKESTKYEQNVSK